MKKEYIQLAGLSAATTSLWRRTRPEYIKALEMSVAGRCLAESLYGAKEVNTWVYLDIPFPVILAKLGLTMTCLEGLTPVPPSTYKKWVNGEKRPLALAFAYSAVVHIHQEISALIGQEPLNLGITLQGLNKLYSADKPTLLALLLR